VPATIPAAATPSGAAARAAGRSPWQIQRAVVFALFVRELKTRFGGRWLGALWFVFEPLANILLMVALFGALHRAISPSIEYPVFLVTGLLPFFILRNLATRLMDAIDANRGLFAYRQVKPMDALVSRAMLELGLYSVVYLVTLALLGWLGYHVVPVRPLELALSSVVLVAFGVGLGVAFAVVTNEVPQLRSVIRLVFFPLYFLSGVIFPVHAIPPQYLSWLVWNPVLHLVELSRHDFFAQYPLLPGISLAYPALWAAVTLALALALYRVRRLRLVAVG
jgi:capsular polysaccharide transport system permease protein